MSFLHLTIVTLLSLCLTTFAADGNCSTAACYSWLTQSYNPPYACYANLWTYITPCTATSTSTITEFTSTETITSTTSLTSSTTEAALHGQITKAASQCPYTSTTTYLPNYSGITSYCDLSQFLDACNCFGISASTVTFDTYTTTTTDSHAAGTTTTSTTTTLTVTSCPYSSTTITLGPFEPTTITNTTTKTKTNYVSTYTDIVSKTVTSHIPGTTTIKVGRRTSTVTATTVPTVYVKETVTATAVATATSTITTTSDFYVSLETTYTITTTYGQPYITPNTCYINEFYDLIQSTSYKVSHVFSTVNATKGTTSCITNTRSLYSASSTKRVPHVTLTVEPSTHTQTDTHTDTVKSTTTTTTVTTTYNEFESFATITVPPCDADSNPCINGQSFDTVCQLYPAWDGPLPPTKLYTNISDYNICANYCGNDSSCGFYLWDSINGDCTTYETTDLDYSPYPEPQWVYGFPSGRTC